MTNDLSRRATIAQLGVVTSLLALGRATSAFAGPAGEQIRRLVRSIDGLSGALRGELVTVADWRAGISDLFSQISQQDLMEGIDFERLAAATGFAELGVSTAKIDFGFEQPRRLNFLPKLFAVNTGRSIIPHGHANMVSAHLPLAGRFHLRQYDQIARDDDALYIRPTSDRVIHPGDLSSIGEDDDNVHWFIAEEPSFTFDVIITGLDQTTEQSYQIFNLDMEVAELRSDGILRAPRMSVFEALRKYG